MRTPGLSADPGAGLTVSLQQDRLGSDFDGTDMPEGMEDCSKLPKGYSDADIRKILGENTLRIMEQAERVSKEMQ